MPTRGASAPPRPASAPDEGDASDRRDAAPESASAPAVSGPAERPGEEGITIRSTFLD